MLWSNLRYKRQPQRRNKQLGDSKEEIDHKHDPPSALQCSCSRRAHCFEHFRRWVIHKVAVYCQEQICKPGNSHTDSNLARSGYFLPTARERREYRHDYRRKHNHKEWIYSLPYLRGYSICLYEVACEQGQRSTVLMEREPEEYGYTQNSKKCIHAALDLICHGSTFLRCIIDRLDILLLGRIGQPFLAGNEDSQ